MKIKINKITVWFLIIILTFNTSLSYANSYLLTPGINTIAKKDFKNNEFTFKVQETGVYTLKMLPSVAVWDYTIEGPTGKSLYLAAMKQEGLKDENGNQLYKVYSKTTPYFVLFKDTVYKICIHDQELLWFDNDNDANFSNYYIKNEDYITVSLGTPLSINSDEYYEATNMVSALVEMLDNGDFSYQYLGYNDDDGEDQPGTKKVKVIDATEKEEKADLVQQLLTGLLVYGIGDGVMWLIGVAAGEPITIDKILFNEYSRTRLGFFTKDVYDENGQIIQNKVNPFLIDSGVLPSGNEKGILNEFFERFTYIAIIAYLIIFLYMGIRIALSSTGKDTAKYKKLFMDWVLGIVILFLFPYVIRYTIRLNDAIVSYIGSLKKSMTNVTIEEPEVVDYPGGLAFPFAYLGADSSTSQDYMSQMRTKALETGKVMYVLCWFVMIKELVAFLFIYIKRMLITMFLIVIFPLVTISYAIDKIGDGKSQAFNNWFKEFFLNVFLQTFQAINYVVVMGIIFAVGKSNSEVNFIFIIIGLTYLAQGDKILRGIFSSHMKGGGGDTVKDVATSMMATSGAMNMLKSSVATIGKGFENLKIIGDKRLNKNNEVSKLQEHKAKQKWDEWNLASGVGQLSAGDTNSSSVTEKHAVQNVNIALSGWTNPEQLRNALGQLRDYSNAGGDMNALYRNMNLNDEQKKQVDDLMEQNDAVDELQNLETLTEAEINASLHVLITNRKRKGNFAKLDRFLENKGIDHKMQNKLFNATNKRKLMKAGEQELNKVRSSICTKEDAQRLRNIEKLDKEIAEMPSLLDRKRNHLKTEIEAIENKLQSSRLRRNGRKCSEYENTLNYLRKRLTQIDYENEKKLFELNQQKETIRGKMINKNAKLPSGSYNKENSVNSYLETARMSNGLGELTDEQKEIAEAQAIVDGSDSGEFTLDEIWKANKKLRNARKTSTDKGVMLILQSAYSNPKTTKINDYFTANLAATIATNEKALSGTLHEKKVLVAEAEEELLKVEDAGVCQHILDDAGLKIGKNDYDEKIIEKLKKDDIVKDLVDEILAEEEKELKKEIENYGEVITDDASYQKMKKKVFQERLDLARDISKATVATVTTPAVALTSAAMYAGAASKFKPEEIIGVSKLATGVTKEVRNRTIDFAMNRVDSVTNIASGINDSAKKGELTTSKALSTILYGDDNEQGVQTRNIALKEVNGKDNLTKEEEYRKKVLEERKVAIERINQKIGRFADEVERNTHTERRPLTQADRNIQIFDRLKNGNNNENN